MGEKAWLGFYFEMRHILLIITLFLFSAYQIRAQQMISVTDKETHEPVPYAAFIQNGDTITYTSLQGIAMMPKVSGRVAISAKNYKPKELNADSLPAVIHLKCTIERLEEVVVIGDSTKIKNKWSLPPNVVLEYDLKDAYNNSGKMAVTKLYKLIGYKTRKERKRKKLKERLEAYDK